MSEELQPPVNRFKLEITIEGNTQNEIESKLWTLANEYEILFAGRDVIDSVSSERVTVKLRETNPDMTPELYERLLTEWFDASRKQQRREVSNG